MQPYSSNTSITNANAINGDGCDLADQNSQPLYIEWPMLTPHQPWVTSSDQQLQAQQSNYTQVYCSNNSFVPNPLPMAASATLCMPAIVSNNSSFPPPLVDGSISSSSSTTMILSPANTASICSNDLIANNFMAPCGNDFAPVSQQPHVHTAYYPQPKDFSPSPSPLTHYRNNSIDSEPSQDFLDDQQAQIGNSDSKQTSGNKSPSAKKREIALERNRQAASRCRQRKKEWLNQLQSNVDILTKENRALEQQSITLREEILNLKTVLLAHCDCSHAPITAASINMDNLLYQTSSPPISAAPPPASSSSL